MKQLVQLFHRRPVSLLHGAARGVTGLPRARFADSIQQRKLAVKVMVKSAL